MGNSNHIRFSRFFRRFSLVESQKISVELFSIVLIPIETTESDDLCKLALHQSRALRSCDHPKSIRYPGRYLIRATYLLAYWLFVQPNT